MHPSDEDSAFMPHDCGQRFRATHDRFSQMTRASKNRVVAPDCRGKDNEISSVCVVGSMLLTKTQTEPLQSIRFHGGNLVRAADRVSQFDQKCGNTTHAAARDTNKMNRVTLTRQESGQIKRKSALARGNGTGPRRRLSKRVAIFRDGLHESYISPWWWRRVRRRPSALDRKNSLPFVESAPD